MRPVSASVEHELPKTSVPLFEGTDDLKNLLTSMALPIVVFGRDLSIRLVTPAAEKLLRLLPADIGRPVGDLKSKFDLGDLASMVATVVENGRTHEALVEDASGHACLLRLHPYRPPDGTVEGAVLLLIDIERTEQRLREADCSKDNFLAVLAHELRTPLAAICNAVQIVGHDCAEVEQRRRAMSVIDSQTVQMVRIVDDLLDLSRLARGTLHLRKQPVDLIHALRCAIDATAHHREGQGQQLCFDAPGPPLMVDADEARLPQLFANLLGNAARHTPQGGHVWMDVTREPAGTQGDVARGANRLETAVVRIRDDGIGIARERVPQLFDLLSDARSAGHRSNGLGIGLNLSRRLIELHGGSIEVSSQGRGLGSEFIVRLPCSSSPAAAVLQSPSAAEPLPATRLRVLVVEGDKDAPEMLRNLLHLANQDVRRANDGETALRIAREFNPHLLLLDMSMPVMDGCELAQRLRADAATSKIFLVAVTAFSPDDASPDLSVEGFDERVTKPLDYEALIALIARIAPDARQGISR